MRLNTRAFAIAGGAVTSAAVFGGTLLVLAVSGPGAASPLARSVLFGYSVSPAGAFIGGMWAYAYGFVGAAAFAFVYNLAAAPSEPPIFEPESAAFERDEAPFEPGPEASEKEPATLERTEGAE